VFQGTALFRECKNGNGRTALSLEAQPVDLIPATVAVLFDTGAIGIMIEAFHLWRASLLAAIAILQHLGGLSKC
jgi:hypothetical protein